MEQKNQSFLAKWLFGKKQQQPDVQEEKAPEEYSTIAETLPHTILVFTPEQEDQFDDETKQRYRKYLTMMPPANIGMVNFVAFEAGHYMGGPYVRCFIRHARDLEEEFTLEAVPLTLYDAYGDKVASGFFRPQNFGTLRFGETRVWTFAWRPEDMLKKDPDFEFFRVAFE